LTQRDACKRSHHRADPLNLLEIGETRNAAEAGTQRDRNAARLVGFGKPHMTLLRAFSIDDRIEDDVAIGTAELEGKNHPGDLELDAEPIGERLAELKLEATAIATLAGERQRIGIGTHREDAAAPDRIERTGARGRQNTVRYRQRMVALKSHGPACQTDGSVCAGSSWVDRQ
jgi:hypothetical protein